MHAHKFHEYVAQATM
ncbi:hypothetical protein F383_38040 [Gossypium arboreum]|uniref:Uncharacterized protein n=1 Tax=Gossypium arboreum TaxID=29729 RepID=A0A0B0MH70_GOSAR|nr:hypothetical protein F383_38040 [Gossypium arboreum]